MLPMTFMALIDDQNDQDLYKELFDKYERMLMTIAIKRLGDYALAEDAVSETFFKIAKCFQKVHNFELAKIAGYAVIIIRNVCNDMLESEQKQQTVIAEISDDLHDEQVLDLYKNKIVTVAVEKLPETYRDAIILKYYYGLSISEIGEQLGLSYNGVRYRIDTALKMLRKEFDDD